MTAREFETKCFNRGIQIQFNVKRNGNDGFIIRYRKFKVVQGNDGFIIRYRKFKVVQGSVPRIKLMPSTTKTFFGTLEGIYNTKFAQL